MSEKRKIRWKISVHTAETMPLDRLAEYMKEIAVVLGFPEHIHLLKVESSSTVPVFSVDEASWPCVQRRAAEVREGTAPLLAMRSYRNINRMLSEDGGDAVLHVGDAEIVPFPGRCVEPSPIAGIQQQGSLDGRLQKVGGVKEWVPIQLRTMEDTNITGCFARRNLAKQLAIHLFEPVRLYGRGRWTRAVTGEWVIERFLVDNFETLSDESLTNIVGTLRSVKADWIDNPVADIMKDGHD